MIRGQTRQLRKPDVELNASIHNRFDIEVVDSKTGKVKQRARAENVICDGFYRCILSSSSSYIANYIGYGSGNGIPASADTALFNQIGCKGVSNITITRVDNNTWSGETKITILETESNNAVITEVGLGTSVMATLCSHAMLKDMNGNIISITKTDTDIINIYATVFLHLSSNMNGFEVYGSTADGQKEMISAAMGLSSWNDANWTSSFYSRSSFLGVDGSQYNSGQYTKTRSSDYKTMTITAPRIGASYGNFSGGINQIKIYGYYSSEQGFKTSLPASWYSGSNITGEAIGTGDGNTKDFATDFVQAPSVVIYVDGVEQTSGVTIDPPSDTVINNIHFTAAPTTGAVITADYHTDVIAKDENHVFDFSMEIQFGEYTT